MARYKDYDYCQTKMIPLSFDRQPRIPPRYGNIQYNFCVSMVPSPTRVSASR